MKNLFQSFKDLFSQRGKNPPKIHTNPSWTLIAEGEITSIKKLNIDKSGRNPKYLIYGSILVSSSQLKGAEFEIPSSINFQGSESLFAKTKKGSVEVGDVMKLRFNGINSPHIRFQLNEVIDHV